MDQRFQSNIKLFLAITCVWSMLMYIFASYILSKPAARISTGPGTVFTLRQIVNANIATEEDTAEENLNESARNLTREHASDSSNIWTVRTGINSTFENRRASYSSMRNDRSIRVVKRRIRKVWDLDGINRVNNIPLDFYARKEQRRKERCLQLFKPVISPGEKANLTALLSLFHKAMAKKNMTYFLYGGSLVGSYRHHDIVPWDDDVDVFVPVSQRMQLRPILRNMGILYNLPTQTWTQMIPWKLYWKGSRKYENRRYSWEWPFLDIFFFEENSTHIWDTHPLFTKSYTFSKALVFPLRQRPFLGHIFRTPFNTSMFVKQHVDMKICETGRWNHKYERHKKSETCTCQLLRSTFPFVDRHQTSAGCNETLVLNGTVINYFFDEGVNC